MMENFHDLMRRTIEEGHIQHNARTGIDCYVLVGEQLKYDLKDGFPAITTKKLAFKSALGELLGFFRGYTSAADFRAIGCKVWDGNANETKAWLESPFRKGEDDCGAIYGAQMTAWRDSRIAKDEAERDFYLGRGYTVEMEGKDGRFAMVRYINQLENALRTILTNPSDRRIIVSSWNVGVLDTMSLPPCHMDYRFVAFEDTKELHLVSTQRSYDEFLAFNTTICALFLEIMARLSGYTARTVTIQHTNAHVYGNHIEQVKLQLSRDHYPAPRLWISDNVRPVTLEEIPGVFERLLPEDFALEGYLCHEAIKAPMAA
jgi:thymidylate synthase